MIHFVQQPDEFSCVAACVAMVSGAPVHDVLKLFPDSKGWSKKEELEALETLGCRSMQEELNQLHFGHAYIATVPSLNAEGGTHCVVIDATGDSYPVVHDPLKGVINKRFYYDYKSVNWGSLTRITGFPEELDPNFDLHFDLKFMWQIGLYASGAWTTDLFRMDEVRDLFISMERPLPKCLTDREYITSDSRIDILRRETKRVKNELDRIVGKISAVNEAFLNGEVLIKNKATLQLLSELFDEI